MEFVAQRIDLESTGGVTWDSLFACKTLFSLELGPQCGATRSVWSLGHRGGVPQTTQHKASSMLDDPRQSSEVIFSVSLASLAAPLQRAKHTTYNGFSCLLQQSNY